jgi:hypothetical protein
MKATEYLQEIVELIARYGHRDIPELLFSFTLAPTTVRTGTEAACWDAAQKCRNALAEALPRPLGIVTKMGFPIGVEYSKLIEKFNTVTE